MRNFHPILNEKKYDEVLGYIAVEAEKLCGTVVGHSLPIDTLTIFAQTPDEYEFLESLLEKKGRVSPLTHGSTLYVEVEQKIEGNEIRLLGARRPDALRAEVGYADFPVKDLEAFKGKDYVSEITSGQGITLLELRHPNFDVRGYIVER